MGGKLNPVCQEKVAPKRGGKLNCRKEVASNPGHSLANTFHHLQRVVGNQTVQRLIRSESIQAKLTIGPPNDVYEQEADRIAKRVMRMPDPGCPTCHQDEDRQTQQTFLPLIQRDMDAGSQRIFDEARIHAGSCPGRPLPQPVREFFEPRLGYDLSTVRVHTCQSAAGMCRDINAQAFTYGSNIYFNSGKYQPASSDGRRLLAHELAHVIQQNAGQKKIQRTRAQDKLSTCHRNGARACVVHLHGSEQVAFRVARDFYCANCVNFFHLTNVEDNCRLFRFVVPLGSSQVTCCADPNQLLDQSIISVNPRSGVGAGDPAIREARTTWSDHWDNQWHAPGRYGMCGCDPRCSSDAFLKSTAIDIARTISIQLRSAINSCHQIVTPIPIVAFHGNTQGALSICSYCPSGSQSSATDQSALNVGGTVVRNYNACCQASTARTPPFLNPHIVDGQDPDDFILVTQQQDFDFFARQGRNVVLQSPSAPNDGSLSVVLGSSGRYVNIEAQRPYLGSPASQRRSEAQSLDIQHQMGGAALGQVMGTAPPATGACPIQGGTGCPDCSTLVPDTPVTPTPPPAPTTRCRLARGSGCRSVARVLQAPTHRIQEKPISTARIDADVSIGSIDSRPMHTFHSAAGRTEGHRRLLQPKWRPIRPRVQRSTYPSTVTNDAQRVEYLMGLASATGAGWTNVRLASGRISPIRSEVSSAFNRMTAAASSENHHITLISTYRSFAHQRDIWNRKMQFDRRAGENGLLGIFNPTASPVSTRCGHILTGAETDVSEWDTANAIHRTCWSLLTEEEKAREILKTSSAPGTSRHHWGTEVDINNLTPGAWNSPPESDIYDWLEGNAHRFGFYQTYTPLPGRGGQGYSEEKWHWSYFPIAQPLLDDYQRLIINVPGRFERILAAQRPAVLGSSFIGSNYEPYVTSVAEGPTPVTSAQLRGRATIQDVRLSRQGFNHFELTITYNLIQMPPEGFWPPSMEIQIVEEATGNVIESRQPTEEGPPSESGVSSPSITPARHFIGPHLGLGRWRWHAMNQGCRPLSCQIIQRYNGSAAVIDSTRLTIPCEFNVSRYVDRPEAEIRAAPLFSGPCIQRHGNHSEMSPVERYQHTFDHAHVSQSVWETGYHTTANFLGIAIQNGVHQQLLSRLVLAERHLRARYASEGFSDAQIATRLGIRYIRGKRPPTLATGRDNISFHCFGLAIDVNSRENLYIAQSEEEGRIIERATALIGGYPVFIRAPGGFSVERLHYRYSDAAQRLQTYFRIRNQRARIAEALHRIGIDPSGPEVDAVMAQIQSDYLDICRRNPGWDPAARGFMDLPLELVQALCQHGGLHWGGELPGGADLMHFDWREGSIRPHHRA